MLNPSTVSICRKLLAAQIKSIVSDLEDLKWAKVAISVLGEPTTEQRKIYLEIESREKALRKRRLKLENAIRDLKACVWNGNPENLPCDYSTTAVYYSPARR